MQPDLKPTQSQALRPDINAHIRQTITQYLRNLNLELNESVETDDTNANPTESKDVSERLSKDLSTFPHRTRNLMLPDNPIPTGDIDAFRRTSDTNSQMPSPAFGSSPQQPSSSDTNNDQDCLPNVPSTKAINFLMCTLPTRHTGLENTVQFQIIKELNLSNATNAPTDV